MVPRDERSAGPGFKRPESAGKMERGPGGRRITAGWIILIAYSLLLMYRALQEAGGSDAAGIAVRELQDSRRLVGWVGGLFLAAALELAYYLPVGFLAGLVAPRGGRRFHRFCHTLAALVLAGALAVLVHGVGSAGRWPPAAAVGLVFPLLGCLLGVWMGRTWLRGWRARLWFLPKFAGLILLAGLGTGALLWLSLEPRPLSFDAAPVTSAEKRRLVRLIRDKSPRSLEEGQTHTLRLTEQDINTLLSWGLSLGSPQRKAMVGLADDFAALSVSMNLPFGKGASRYLNIQVAGDAGVEKGVLTLKVSRCTLGSVELPRWLLRLLCPAVTSLLSHDRLTRPFLEAVQSMEIEPHAIECTYGRVLLPPGFREDLFGPSVVSQDVLESTRAQVEHLLAAVGRPPQPPSFGLCLETVFTLARDRSVGRDPIAENRAGIFALGVLLGHPRVEEFLGPVLDEDGQGATLRVLRRVTLRGRSDWTKHFCVSAALALLSDEAVSDAAGLLKEELDAGQGGSGFSFADLLADRAGTTFVLSATRDEAAARALQDRLARGFQIDEFFPPAADLPEGIPDAELQAQYGGVGGPAYRHLTEEIERRIAACAAYR